ncbi:unnamed protein product [Meganyctiphanes norvegica]|uniref:Receptor ligand binding region domain-containing protein n=1 Tax=Meganyctiphanes norvegica TaxID=48144 RepID=A0AAV2S7J7_MEGNR
MGWPWQQKKEVLQPPTRLGRQRVWSLPCQRCRPPMQDLYLILLVSLFLLLLASHTCTGTETDTTTTPGTPKPTINVGIIMPQSRIRTRAFQNKIRGAIRPFDGDLGDRYEFSYTSFIQVRMPHTPTPKSILDIFCHTFLPQKVSAIIYPSMDKTFGPNTISSQNFLQLAGYLGIPVIAWNADNSGLEQASKSGLVIQMAPSIHHQVAAMLSILERYEWHAFTIVTSMIAGHTDFVQTIRDQVHQYGDPQDTSKPNVKFTIIDSLLVTDPAEDLHKISSSEARILLYCTKDEAMSIMKKADEMQLTGKNFVWIVTQSVIGADPNNVPKDLPVGMLGVHFETNSGAHMRAIGSTIRVFAYGVKKFLNDPTNEHISLQPEMPCNVNTMRPLPELSSEGNATRPWPELTCDGNATRTCALNAMGPSPIGNKFYRVLKSLTIPYDQVYDDSGKVGQTKTLEFLGDGTRKDVQLKIMNLRKSRSTLDNLWEEIGTWSSLGPDKVYINEIVWPGDQHDPPPAVPEKSHLKPSMRSTATKDHGMIFFVVGVMILSVTAIMYGSFVISN